MPHREGFKNSLNFTISLCLIFTVSVAAVRFWIRRGQYGIDDFIIAIGTILSLARSGTSYAALQFGLGQPAETFPKGEALGRLNDTSLSGLIIFLVSLYTTKCAMMAFLGRVTSSSDWARAYHILNGFVGLLGLGSVLLAVISCSASSGFYWNIYKNLNSCPAQGTRWQVITGLDIFSEALTLVLPVHLVWNLEMRRSKKIMLTAAFWIRIPVLLLSLGRGMAVAQLQQPGTDIGLQSALVAIWMDVELAFALAASTMSASKSFTENFNVGFGLGFTRGKSEQTQGLALDLSRVKSEPSYTLSRWARSSHPDGRKDEEVAMNPKEDVCYTPLSPVNSELWGQL